MKACDFPALVNYLQRREQRWTASTSTTAISSVRRSGRIAADHVSCATA
jgi:hypothetical protein